MRYLVSVIDDTAGLATPDEMAAINAFNDRLKAEGHWVGYRSSGPALHQALPPGSAASAPTELDPDEARLGLGPYLFDRAP